MAVRRLSRFGNLTAKLTFLPTGSDAAFPCEAMHEACLRIVGDFGAERCIWGSDFPISQQRGRCVTLGTGFVWITTDQVKWNKNAFFGEPLLVGLESTKALLDATDRLGLNSADLDDIFHDNVT